jgi:hypothetical protein
MEMGRLQRIRVLYNYIWKEFKIQSTSINYKNIRIKALPVKGVNAKNEESWVRSKESRNFFSWNKELYGYKL